MDSWREEPWAQGISGLSRPDRMALVSAACLILKYERDLPGALESQLTVFLDCACGTDLEPRPYDLRTVLSHYISDFQGTVEQVRSDLDDLRAALPEATAEYRAALPVGTPAPGEAPPDMLRSIDAKLDQLLGLSPHERTKHPPPVGDDGTSDDRPGASFPVGS